MMQQKFRQNAQSSCVCVSGKTDFKYVVEEEAAAARAFLKVQCPQVGSSNRHKNHAVFF